MTYLRFKWVLLALGFSLSISLIAQPKKKGDSVLHFKNKVVQKDSAQEPISSVTRDSTNVMLYSAVTQPCNYMSKQEKEVIWYLNIARMYPQWYLYFFLKHPRSENEKSLYQNLKNRKGASKKLVPNKTLFEIAKCHAVTSGLAGYEGHERQSPNCKKGYNGECCQYGHQDAKDIVLDLLVDEGVPSLGHRTICLDSNYTKIGVSIQPHKGYGVNAVLDFKF